LHDVHPEDQIVLDVSRDNPGTRATYERYGFAPTDRTFEHGVFATVHEQLATPAQGLQRRLGTIALID
jgi:hypothetical protein